MEFPNLVIFYLKSRSCGDTLLISGLILRNLERGFFEANKERSHATTSHSIVRKETKNHVMYSRTH
jgi:hypothetical protein